MFKFKRIHKRWKLLPWWLRLTLMIVLGVLILARLALPYVLQNYVNYKLSHLDGYEGSIGGVTVHLWRGAYRIHDLDIRKTSGKVAEPLFKTAYLDLSIEWLQLFHGAVVGKVFMKEPTVNFVAGPTEAESQLGEKAGWDQLLTSLFPFRLNRLESLGGAVHFRDHHHKPPVDIFMNELNLVATNLSNVQGQNEALPTHIEATSKTIGGGAFDVHIKLNLLEKEPTFELLGNIDGMDLKAANSFMLAYGGFDVGKGTLTLYASVASKGGAYDGYLKIFFKDLHVFVWKKERKKDVLHIFWDAVVGTTTTILKNPNGTLAAKVPISGSFGKSQVGTWKAIGSVLENAFIRSMLPKLDEKITVKTMEKKAKEKKAKKDGEKAKPTPSPSQGPG